MATQTATLQLEADASMRGDLDGIEDLRRTVNFKELDDIFRQFLATNENYAGHWDAPRLLDISDCDKRGMIYSHFDIPYLATVFLYKGPKLWLNIKLNNDGFVYSPSVGATPFPFVRHRSLGWGRVSLDDHRKFACVRSFMATAKCNKMIIYYHAEAERVDIKLYPSDGKGMCVLISFEKGHPWVDEDNWEPDWTKSWRK